MNLEFFKTKIFFSHPTCLWGERIWFFRGIALSSWCGNHNLLTWMTDASRTITTPARCLKSEHHSVLLKNYHRSLLLLDSSWWKQMSAAQVAAAQCHGLGYLLHFVPRIFPSQHADISDHMLKLFHLPRAVQSVSDTTYYGAEISTLQENV